MKLQLSKFKGYTCIQRRSCSSRRDPRWLILVNSSETSHYKSSWLSTWIISSSLTAVLLQPRVTQPPSLYVTMHHTTCGGLVSLVCAHLLLPQIKESGVATTLSSAPKLTIHQVGFENTCCNHIYDFNINILQLVLSLKLEEINKEKNKKTKQTHKKTKPPNQ